MNRDDILSDLYFRVGALEAEVKKLKKLLKEQPKPAERVAGGHSTKFPAMKNYEALLEGRISLEEYGKTTSEDDED